jgi:transcriptional regulator with XRE-family HTH domain
MYVNLKVCLWQSGLRQNRLAQALQMDEALLSRIINGFRQPTPEQRMRIAEILRRDETWLFARDPQSAAPPEAAEKELADNSGHEEALGSSDHSRA